MIFDFLKDSNDEASVASNNVSKSDIEPSKQTIASNQPSPILPRHRYDTSRKKAMLLFLENNSGNESSFQFCFHTVQNRVFNQKKSWLRIAMIFRQYTYIDKQTKRNFSYSTRDF